MRFTLLVTIILASVSVNRSSVSGQDLANRLSLVQEACRLEELHRNIYTTVDWIILNDTSSEYESLATKLKSASNQLMQLGPKSIGSSDLIIKTQFLRSLRILAIDPNSDVLEVIKSGIRTESSEFLEEVIGYLIEHKAKLGESDLLNLLSRTEPELIADGVKLYAIAGRNTKIEERIAAILQHPVLVMEFVGGHGSFERDARCEILENLARSKVVSKTIREQCEKLTSSDAPVLKASAWAYLCATASQVPSSECVRFHKSIANSPADEQFAIVRAGLLSGVLSRNEQSSAIAAVAGKELLRRQSIGLLRMVSTQGDDGFQEIIRSIIESASSDELFLFARELEYIHLSRNNINNLAVKISSIGDVNGILATRAAIVSLVRSAYSIAPNSILDFKQYVQNNSVSVQVRNFLRSVDNDSLFRVRHRLAGSSTIKK